MAVDPANNRFRVLQFVRGTTQTRQNCKLANTTVVAENSDSNHPVRIDGPRELKIANRPSSLALSHPLGHAADTTRSPAKMFTVLDRMSHKRRVTLICKDRFELDLSCGQYAGVM
jgi:hypothetical protein